MTTLKPLSDTYIRYLGVGICSLSFLISFVIFLVLVKHMFFVVVVVVVISEIFYMLYYEIMDLI